MSLQDDIQEALDNLASYSTPSPRIGRPGQDEFWEDAKATTSDVLKDDPDSLFYLIREASDLLASLARRSRTVVAKLISLAPSLRITPRPFSPGPVGKVRQHLASLQVVAASEGGRQRRTRSLQDKIRLALLDHKGTSFIGSEPVKNRDEALVESREMLEDLGDLHDRLVIIPPAILNAKVDYEDKGMHAGATKRHLATADDGLKAIEAQALAHPAAGAVTEHGTTLQLVALSALVDKTSLVDPELAKIEGVATATGESTSPEVVGANYPPYVFGDGGVVDLEVDGLPHEWSVPASLSARLKTRAVTADDPVVLVEESAAELAAQNSYPSGVDMGRYETTGTPTVTMTPVGVSAAGKPALAEASAAIFAPGNMYPGDTLIVKTLAGPGPTGDYELCRILSITDDDTALIEIPTSESVGTYDVLGAAYDMRLTVVLNGAQHTVEFPEANVLAAVETGVFPWTGNGTSFFFIKLNEQLPYDAFTTLFTGTVLGSQSTGEDETVSIDAPESLAEAEISAPVQFLFNFRSAADTLEDVGSTDNRFLDLELDDAFLSQTVDGFIAAGTYTDAASLASAISAALGTSLLTASADADDRIVLERSERGTLKWAKVLGGTANGQLGLTEGHYEKGADVDTDQLDLSTQEQGLPVETTADSDILIPTGTLINFGISMGISSLGTAESGDRLIVRAPATDKLLIATTNNYLPGQTLTGPTGTAKIADVLQLGPPLSFLVVTLTDQSGTFGVADIVSTPSGIGIVQMTPGDAVEVGTYTVDTFTSSLQFSLARIPKTGLYEAEVVRPTFGLRSLSEMLDASLQVLAGVAQAIIGFPTAEVRGEASWLHIEGVDLATQVRPEVRVGDIVIGLSVGDAVIEEIDAEGSKIAVSPKVPNDESATIQVFALGAIGLPAYRSALNSWWKVFGKSPFVETLVCLRQGLEQARRSSAIWVERYVALLDQYDALLENALGLLDYKALTAPGMEAVLDGLMQNRLLAARELLLSCRIKEYMELSLDEASDWANAVKALHEFQVLIPAPNDPDDLSGFLDTHHQRPPAVPPEDLADPEAQNVDLIPDDEYSDDEVGSYG